MNRGKIINSINKAKEELKSKVLITYFDNRDLHELFVRGHSFAFVNEIDTELSYLIENLKECKDKYVLKDLLENIKKSVQ